MEGLSEELLAFIVILGAVAIGYGKFMGPYQTDLTTAFVKALSVKSRYRPVVNLAVGIVLGLGITAAAAFYIDNKGIIPLGILAGIFASSEASKKYDATETKEKIADQVVDQVQVTDARGVNHAGETSQGLGQVPRAHPTGVQQRGSGTNRQFILTKEEASR
jgi:hypothetical protein